MNRLFIIFLMQVYIFFAFGQSNIAAEKEYLGIIPIGERHNQVSYLSTEEGFLSRGGIYVDSEEQLFFIQNFRLKPILRFKENVFYQTPIPQNVPNTWFGPSSYGISQEGVSGEGSFFFTLDSKNQYKQTDFFSKLYMKPTIAKWYPTPWGVIWESIDGKQLVSAEYKVGAAATLRTLPETRAWLPTQPGGFSIGDDGLLYRSGIVWSAVRPKDGSPAGKYLGKTMSGHNIWTNSNNPGYDRFFTISNAQGKTELVLEIPWGQKDNSATYDEFNLYNYGLGPWGELYCLIAPKPQIKGNWPVWESGEAELVVVRNHLKYFGRLNDGGVRLRKEPTTASDIVGTYPIKTGFRILEKGLKEETIGGQKNVWYKVRLLDGMEGWFFGSFVANLYDGPNGKPPPWPNVPDW